MMFVKRKYLDVNEWLPLLEAYQYSTTKKSIAVARINQKPLIT